MCALYNKISGVSLSPPDLVMESTDVHNIMTSNGIYLFSFPFTLVKHTYGTGTLFEVRWYWANNITFKTYSSAYFDFWLNVTAITTTTYSVSLYMGGVVTGSYVSTTATLTIGKPYVLMMEFKVTKGTDIKPQCILIENPQPGVPQTVKCDLLYQEAANAITGDAVNNAPTYVKLVGLYSTSTTLESTLILFEPYYIGKGIIDCFIEGPWPGHYYTYSYWSARRTLWYTYYSGTYFGNYVVPPYIISNSSIYDATVVLHSRIEDLSDEVEDLMTALSDAQLTIDALTDKTDIIDWNDLASTTVAILQVFALSSSKLTHLNNVLKDPIGALKTNLYRILSETANQRLEAQ